MIFVIHQYASVTGILVSPSLWTALPSPTPPHSSRLSQSTSFRFPSSHIILPLVIWFTHGNIYVSKLFSQIIPPFPSPSGLFWVQKSVLCFCFFCCPACRITCATFLDSTYVHQYTTLVFLFLTYSLCVTGSGFTHLIRTDVATSCGRRNFIPWPAIKARPQQWKEWGLTIGPSGNSPCSSPFKTF